MNNAPFGGVCASNFSRLQKQNNAREGADYVAGARKDMALQAAALAWSQGVPWAEALSIATKSIKKAAAKLVGKR